MAHLAQRDMEEIQGHRANITHPISPATARKLVRKQGGGL